MPPAWLTMRHVRQGAGVTVPRRSAPSMPTCLVVDDDSGQRLLTRLVVEGSGRFQVVGEAQDGLEAIAMAESLAPDLILLDLNMPRMGGTQALPGLRVAAPNATVYVLSTVKDPARLHEAKAAGAHGFLDKMLPNDRLRTELVNLRLRV